MTTKNVRPDLQAKIVVVKGAENTYRPGTAVHKRVGCVLRGNGKTVRDVVKAGARTSTVRHLVEAKLIRLVTPAKTAKAA